jgi:hypothetical protein
VTWRRSIALWVHNKTDVAAEGGERGAARTRRAEVIGEPCLQPAINHITLIICASKFSMLVNRKKNHRDMEEAGEVIPSDCRLTVYINNAGSLPMAGN